MLEGKSIWTENDIEHKVFDVRILLYIAKFSHLTGGEINARDWAHGLASRGHQVIVYSPILGKLAEEASAASIPVVDDPAKIHDRPDVMFGAGVNEAVTVAARFPNVPVVQVSQNIHSWTEFPALLPQVVLHVAVDELNSEMLINEFGVPRDCVRVVLNAVDLKRVWPRAAPLPARPARALVFAKYDPGWVEATASACAARNIAVSVIGAGVAREVHDPFAFIAEHDLVFGSARTAIESAAGGAAVIVADQRGLAGLLTPARYEEFRRNNFGFALLKRPLNAVTIGSEIDAYSAGDAAAVAERVRTDADLDRQLSILETIFNEAMARLQAAPPSDDATSRALGTYLAAHLPRIVEAAPRYARFAQRDAPSERLDAIEQRMLSKLRIAVDVLNRQLLDIENMLKDVAPRLSSIERDVQGFHEMFWRNRRLLALVRPIAVAARRLCAPRGCGGDHDSGKESAHTAK
jgi:hypothetical protein